MTAELRAQVVTLLRETADKYKGIADAYSKIYGVDVSPEAHQLNWNWRGSHPIWDNAVRAREDVERSWRELTGGVESYEDSCLRAADCIEEGSWPR